MDFAALFKEITEIGQSTNGGFTVIALIASIACWLLYRGTRTTMLKMAADLKECNDKHTSTDKEIAVIRDKATNLSISTASLWTIISMSGDRRGYELPPLNEVLEGRMVIQIRAGGMEAGKAPTTPLVYTDKGIG